VPPKFTAGFLSFARATYTFAGGEELAIESVRSCRARKKLGTPKAQRHVASATTPHPTYPIK
jgi:hypothetical protein